MQASERLMMRLSRVHANDGERVQEFVRGLSAGARLERFFVPLAELPPRELARITAGPGTSLAALDDHEAIVALAEYAQGEPGEAEFALVVADAWQGRGLGERLLAALLEHAQRAGIARMQGVTRASNDAMRRLARKLGFGVQRDADPHLVRLERVIVA